MFSEEFFNQCKEETARSLLTLSHYRRPDLEHGGYVYVKNKLGSQIYSTVYKFTFVL